MPLSFVFPVALPRNLTEIFRRYNSTYVWVFASFYNLIFFLFYYFNNFCIFGDVTYFVAGKVFFLLCIQLLC